MVREFRETPQTERGGRATVQNDQRVDIKMSAHTLGLVLEQIEGALDPAVGCEPTRSDLIKMLGLVASDLSLVKRTLDGVQRRGER